jgi:nucleoid-associated protein YgaU
MDQRLRLAVAAAVMLSGLGVALFFRHPSADTDLPIAVPSDSLVLRKQPDPRTFAAGEALPGQAQPRSQQSVPLEPRRVSPTIVTPADQPAPPPELPKSYPGNGASGTSGQAASTRWGASMSQMLPERASAPPTHKVIDGDTLEILAERYLGSASRAMEIYEANRDVPYLTPKILPMGAELKIPRGDQAANHQ